jgi:hypothetical protein
MYLILIDNENKQKTKIYTRHVLSIEWRVEEFGSNLDGGKMLLFFSATSRSSVGSTQPTRRVKPSRQGAQLSLLNTFQTLILSLWNLSTSRILRY